MKCLVNSFQITLKIFNYIIGTRFSLVQCIECCEWILKRWRKKKRTTTTTTTETIATTQQVTRVKMKLNVMLPFGSMKWMRKHLVYKHTMNIYSDAMPNNSQQKIFSSRDRITCTHKWQMPFLVCWKKKICIFITQSFSCNRFTSALAFCTLHYSFPFKHCRRRRCHCRHHWRRFYAYRASCLKKSSLISIPPKKHTYHTRFCSHPFPCHQCIFSTWWHTKHNTLVKPKWYILIRMNDDVLLW